MPFEEKSNTHMTTVHRPFLEGHYHVFNFFKLPTTDKQQKSAVKELTIQVQACMEISNFCEVKPLKMFQPLHFDGTEKLQLVYNKDASTQHNLELINFVPCHVGEP